MTSTFSYIGTLPKTSVLTLVLFIIAAVLFGLAAFEHRVLGDRAKVVRLVPLGLTLVTIGILVP